MRKFLLIKIIFSLSSISLASNLCFETYQNFSLLSKESNVKINDFEQMFLKKQNSSPVFLVDQFLKEQTRDLESSYQMLLTNLSFKGTNNQLKSAIQITNELLDSTMNKIKKLSDEVVKTKPSEKLINELNYDLAQCMGRLGQCKTSLQSQVKIMNSYIKNLGYFQDTVEKMISDLAQLNLELKNKNRFAPNEQETIDSLMASKIIQLQGKIKIAKGFLEEKLILIRSAINLVSDSIPIMKEDYLSIQSRLTTLHNIAITARDRAESGELKNEAKSRIDSFSDLPNESKTHTTHGLRLIDFIEKFSLPTLSKQTQQFFVHELNLDSSTRAGKTKFLSYLDSTKLYRLLFDKRISLVDLKFRMKNSYNEYENNVALTMWRYLFYREVTDPLEELGQKKKIDVSKNVETIELAFNNFLAILNLTNNYETKNINSELELFYLYVKNILDTELNKISKELNLKYDLAAIGSEKLNALYSNFISSKSADNYFFNVIPMSGAENKLIVIPQSADQEKKIKLELILFKSVKPDGIYTHMTVNPDFTPLVYFVPMNNTSEIMSTTVSKSSWNKVIELYSLLKGQHPEVQNASKNDPHGRDDHSANFNRNSGGSKNDGLNEGDRWINLLNELSLTDNSKIQRELQSLFPGHEINDVYSFPSDEQMNRRETIQRNYLNAGKSNTKISTYFKERYRLPITRKVLEFTKNSDIRNFAVGATFRLVRTIQPQSIKGDGETHELSK